MSAEASESSEVSRSSSSSSELVLSTEEVDEELTLELLKEEERSEDLSLAEDSSDNRSLSGALAYFPGARSSAGGSWTMGLAFWSSSDWLG